MLEPVMANLSNDYGFSASWCYSFSDGSLLCLCPVDKAVTNPKIDHEANEEHSVRRLKGIREFIAWFVGMRDIASHSVSGPSLRRASTVGLRILCGLQSTS